MDKDQTFGKPQDGCSAHDCTGIMPAAVSRQEQHNLDEMEGLHDPAEPSAKAPTAKKCCRCPRGERQTRQS